MEATAFDEKFDKGEDITGFLDLKSATVVQRVNVDFPSWMVDMLDREAIKLNVSRQAIIKMWIRERLDPSRRLTL
ncbi:MAG: CopG family transcriptional regulator [Nitrospirota bacterium]